MLLFQHVVQLRQPLLCLLVLFKANGIRNILMDTDNADRIRVAVLPLSAAADVHLTGHRVDIAVHDLGRIFCKLGRIFFK